ncbi:MAG: DUF998 domain-containing protein [Bacteroidetes bacterium]|nr:MAG: DUF998 domain-containing protein [Bacteroidota bacterium]
MTNLKLFCFSGMLIPIIYIFMYLLGGALRKDYSHISNSVSELLSPGAPNKRMLVPIQVVYAALHIIFGFGVLWFINGWESIYSIGQIGAWLIIALGLTTFGTVIFPQDDPGQPETRAGRLHKILVFGGLVPFSILSTLFIGLWARKAGFSPGFDIYSFITVGATVVMGIAGGLSVETRFAGLVERIAAIVTQQWLFILGLILLLHYQ